MALTIFWKLVAASIVCSVVLISRLEFFVSFDRKSPDEVQEYFGLATTMAPATVARLPSLITRRPTTPLPFLDKVLWQPRPRRLMDQLERDQLFRLGSRRLTRFSCASLFTKHTEDYNSTIELAKQWTPSNSSSGLGRTALQDAFVRRFFRSRNLTSETSCEELRASIELPTAPLTQDEADFPLAYAMLIHDNFPQFLRLLRRIYMPQNVYCVHVDAKSHGQFQESARRLVSCLPNVILSSKQYKVYWGHPSVLRAAVVCLKDLNALEIHRWKYVQILSESDFPLKTNYEMVQIFKLLNGSNDSDLQSVDMERILHPYVEARSNETERIEQQGMSVERLDSEESDVWYKNKNRTKPIPPGDLRVFKGSFAASMTRDFVNFMANSKLADEYLEWISDTSIPDETYWSTLIHNAHIGAPGSFPGFCWDYFHETQTKKPFISRYQTWEYDDEVCLGRWIRGSCEFGVEHLSLLIQQPQLIAHKFSLEFEPAALYCLDELLSNRTFGLAERGSSLDFEYYSNLPSVQYSRMNDKSKFECRLGVQT